MNIFLLNGSVANKSHTKALLKYLQQLFEQIDTDTFFWDLKESPLPIVLPQYHRDPMEHPDSIVHEFAQEITNADGIILGSPLYHGSYSGVLKNALDNLHYDAFRGKFVGLVGNAGSIRADHVQVVHLRQVVKTLFGYTLQTQVETCEDDYELEKGEYQLFNEGILKRCQRLVDEMHTMVGNMK